MLAPTRELAIQIDKSFSTYGKFLRLRQALVYGGVGQNPQVRALKQGTHILVATPGRLLDLMNQGHVRLDQLQVFVLDEADRMLDMGFLPDLNGLLPSCRNGDNRCFIGYAAFKNHTAIPMPVTKSRQRKRHAQIDKREKNRAARPVR